MGEDYAAKMRAHMARAEKLKERAVAIENAALKELGIPDPDAMNAYDVYRLNQKLKGQTNLLERLSGGRNSNTNAAIMYGIAALLERERR